MSPERVSVGEEGEGHSMLKDRKQKGAGTNSGESGPRNLKAESIRFRRGGESMGGRVKLKKVTEIKRSSARDTFIAESVHSSFTCGVWLHELLSRLALTGSV